MGDGIVWEYGEAEKDGATTRDQNGEEGGPSYAASLQSQECEGITFNGDLYPLRLL